MRRIFPLIVALTLALGTLPALALPGPDPVDAPSTFELVVQEQGPEPKLTYDRLPFARADGWDFGDRESYVCAHVERFASDGTQTFRVEVELNEDYPPVPGIVLNDRGGLEVEHGDNPPPKPPVGTPDGCGAPSGEGGWVHDPATEDHFPHHTHQHLFVDGVEAPSAFLDLHRPDCARGYWTPGDEPGETILWWDVDGPTHTHPGSPELPCAGGPGEPLAVARMLVTPLTANTGVCTHDALDGSRCTGMVTPPPPPPPPCVVNPKTGVCKTPKA